MSCLNYMIQFLYKLNINISIKFVNLSPIFPKLKLTCIVYVYFWLSAVYVFICQSIKTYIPICLIEAFIKSRKQFVFLHWILGTFILTFIILMLWHNNPWRALAALNESFLNWLAFSYTYFLLEVERWVISPAPHEPSR